MQSPILQGFASELGQIFKEAQIPLKAMAHPAVAKFLDSVAAGGPSAPKLFKGAPPLKIKGVNA